MARGLGVEVTMLEPVNAAPKTLRSWRALIAARTPWSDIQSTVEV